MTDEFDAANPVDTPPEAAPEAAPAEAPLEAEPDWKSKFEALQAAVNEFSEAYRTYGAGAGSSDAALKLITFLGHVRHSVAPPTMDQKTGVPI